MQSSYVLLGFACIFLGSSSISTSDTCKGLHEEPRITTIEPRDYSSPAIYILVAQRNVQNVSIFGLKSDGSLGKSLVLSDFNKVKTPRPANSVGLGLFQSLIPVPNGSVSPTYGVSVPLKELQRSDTDWYVTCADHLDVVDGEKRFCSYCSVSRARPICDNDTVGDPSLNQPCGVDYSPVEVLQADYYKAENSMLVKFAVDELPTAQANVVVTVRPVKCTAESSKLRKTDILYPSSFVTLNITDLPEKKFSVTYRVYLDIPVKSKQANFLLASNAIRYGSIKSASSADACGADESVSKASEKPGDTPEGFESALQGIGNLFNNFGAKVTGDGNSPKR